MKGHGDDYDLNRDKINCVHVAIEKLFLQFTLTVKGYTFYLTSWHLRCILYKTTNLLPIFSHNILLNLSAGGPVLEST